MFKHLWERHRIPADARDGLSAYVRSFLLPNPNKLRLRRDNSSPHPHLAVHNSPECRQCEYRSTSVTLAVQHLAKSHQHKKGGKNWIRDGMIEDIYLQSRTQNGARDYWRVGSENVSSTVQTSQQSSPRRRERIATLHEQEKTRLTDRRNGVATTETSIDDPASTCN